MSLPEYPPPAFYFTARIGESTDGVDSSFQEVSGIGSEIETEDVAEEGENRFVHRLPKAVKHPLLVLKRGLAVESSPLIRWCRQVLDSGPQSKIEPKLVSIYLRSQSGDTIADSDDVDQSFRSDADQCGAKRRTTFSV